MEKSQLNSDEVELVSIIREFSFLRQENYHEKNISRGHRELPSITYENNLNKLKVHIIGSGNTDYTIVIERDRTFGTLLKNNSFDISDYYSKFGKAMVKSKSYSLRAQADFIKENLMSVIRGEMWIDEVTHK